MKVVGLTGGIGSGKTTVANFFHDLGVPVYIADEEAKKLMNVSTSLKEEIIALFGEQAYKKNHLDRKFIASLVFGNKEKLESLNALVHPEVTRHFNQWKQKQTAPYLLYEAAILFEKGGYKKCDFNILVTANHSEKIKRLVQRDNSTIEEIAARMSHQWPDEKKLKLADFIIENKDFSTTREQVQKIHNYLLKEA